MSEGTATLAAALACARAVIPRITKGRTARVKMKAGGEYSYSYADLADVLEAISGPLSANGLAISHTMEVGEAALFLRTRLLHASGESLESVYPLPHPQDVGPQEVGSAITYARRYAVCAIVGIAAEEDDDGQAAQATRVTRAAPPRPGNARSEFGPRQGATEAVTPLAPAGPVVPPAVPAVRLISEPQRKRLYAIASEHGGEAGLNKEQLGEAVHSVLRQCGYETSKEIAASDYERVCDLVESALRAMVPPDAATAAADAAF